ncbi:hypothetical protein INS49_015343 [Diaporthe citri]|uniref:uncharacterized protein n=1 Tax=Diaporthe citri TaxID=83186 RepID=UPI001C814E36|nr:uncharacterized protein INS49_015343 [Diaporthe citri]KAG6355958.1 hypothetical protein INS49_015343 [Diaporthe citri]
MATLDSLKRALRQAAEEAALPSSKPLLSDSQYSAGLDILKQGAGWLIYEDFIIPYSSRLLGPLFDSHPAVSVLEIGPGATSLLSYLPRHLRHKVKKYKAFEPNSLLAAGLEESLGQKPEGEATFPYLKSPPDICRQQFDAGDKKGSDTTSTNDSSLHNDEKYDAIIFCHSMYGMKPKHMFIERALNMLTGSPDHPDKGGLILVFHRDNGALHLGDLVCYQTASFPTGVVSVTDDDEELDSFASFVTGFSMQGETDASNTIRAEWRKATEQSRTARHSCTIPLPVVQPKEIKDVQFAVRWALECELNLTVVGGGHSGHCLWPNVVSVDMSAFNQIHIVKGDQDGKNPTFGPLVVAETGCKTGDIVRKTMAEGLTVPLGARPSVGAGMWLQGGIGHLARMYGLSCDAIVGAVMVSVKDYSQIICVGHVPSQHKPPGAIKPENDAELLRAIKGAGTNFGIVISVIFQAYVAPTYRARNWLVKFSDSLKGQRKLSEFDSLIAEELPRNISADAYLYWEDGKLRLGVTMFESLTGETTSSFEQASAKLDFFWGPGDDLKATNAVDLFDTEMYVSRMHGGHGGGKTLSFKRCVFLKHIGEAEVAGHLLAAIENRPSPLCYLHLLQGGGAICDVAPDATAFGCRDWDFACVITGVWPRDEDDTEIAQYATQWVYDVAGNLLALSGCRGVYGADLGPDPRDSVLATKAFGPIRRDLAFLKRTMDPQEVLEYACPLPEVSLRQKIIILVTGESCAGKDFCADVWVSVLTRRKITCHEQLTARVVSISSATKREYAAAKGADLGRLLWDRAYKEQQRPDLTAFFKSQERERPDLPKEQFLNVVRIAGDVDVLLITGMRDEAPLATFSHLVPESRLLEVYVQASDQNRRSRGGRDNGDGSNETSEGNSSWPDTTVLPYRPSLTFINNMSGSEAAEEFAKHHLFPFLHHDLQDLADMVGTVPDFPRQGIEFRHVLGIAEEYGGLTLCTSLLQSHFVGGWATVNSIASCETGGLIFASALALQVKVPLLPIRKAGKLPPPTVSVAKKPSYVSSAASEDAREERIELELDKVPEGPGARVVVVDDVLSKGETLCAVLELLEKAGVHAENVSVMVVAEFPVHRGRELLRQRGFGRTSVQSLLVFGGA